jgi:hypothetical protein
MAVRKDGHFFCLHNSFGLKVLTQINLFKTILKNMKLLSPEKHEIEKYLYF